MGYRRRLLVLFLATAAALAAVWVRTFWVQVVTADQWQQAAASQRTRLSKVGAPRGRILDGDGATLAEDQSVVRLVFVPGEWASRERFRCGRCGAVSFRRTPRFSDRPDRPATPPRRCSCGAPKEELSPLPAEDLAPLEEALQLPPGTLAAAAEDRMADIETWVETGTIESLLWQDYRLRRGDLAREARRDKVPIEDVIERWKPRLEGQEFLADDLRRQRRADWYARPFPMTAFRLPASGGSIVKKRISPEAERLLELDVDGRYRGFRAELATQRHYPEGALLAQVIGFTRPFRDRKERERYQAEREEAHATDDTQVGRAGLEEQYDVELSGSAGEVRRDRDATGEFSRVTVLTPPRRGEDLRLHATIPACKEAYEALKSVATDEGYGLGGPASGGFVAMDAETGAILAWADTPLFDLNGSMEDIVTKLEEAEEAEAKADGGAPVVRPKPGVWNSRVASVEVEPGSSLKIATVLALLSASHPAREGYECVGPRRDGVDPRMDSPKCHLHVNPVGPETALTVSCNRWCADCASDPAYRAEHVVLFPTWADRLGIGKATGIDFPRTRVGVYPRPAQLAAEPWRLRQASIGQSVLATPLHMVRIAAFVANGRGLPIPRLAAEVGGQQVQGGLVPVACDPAALARVRAGMRGCVESPHGTAHDKFDGPGLAGVTVYGKTGTATATGQFADGDPSDGPWHLWFIGYATKPGARTVAFAAVVHDRKARDANGGGMVAPAVARWLSWWYSR